MSAKHFSAAQAIFMKAIRTNPNLVDAHENLALLLLLKGDDVGAEAQARLLLRLDASNYNGRLVFAVAAVNQLHYAEGARLLAPLTAGLTNDPIILATLGVALHHLEKNSLANKVRATLSHVAVEERDAMVAGQVFRQVDLRRIAKGWIETSLARQPGLANSDLSYILAGMYADEGLIDKAAALYEGVIATDPNNVDALVELSELETKRGNKQEGLSRLYAAKQLASRDKVSLLHFSQICVRRHMYVDARDALRQVVALDPEDHQAWYQLGLAQYSVGETDAAEVDFQNAKRLDEKDAWSLVGLGAVLMNTSREQLAEVEFQRALAVDPRCAAAHYYLGLVRQHRGDLNGAREHLEDAALDASHDARPVTALGQLEVQEKHPEKAKRMFAKALALDPTSAMAHYRLALLLRSEGDQRGGNQEMSQFEKYHKLEQSEGIVGIVPQGQWNYAGFVPAS